MSDQAPANFEFLKKHAKVLLKQCRSGDAAAIARIRASIPRLSTLNDVNLAGLIKLSHVQHVLAREHGYANWAAFRRHKPEAIDFSEAGSYGLLPDNFIPWRSVLSYTVHPELLAPAEVGQERRFVVSAVRKVSKAEDAGYADLYERALKVAKGRASRLQCAAPRTRLHTRIVTQGWFTHSNVNLARVFITLGAVYLKEGQAAPEGLTRPTPADLANAGGMTPDNTALPPEQVKQGVFESYVFSDHDDAVAPETNIFTVSYGEYVPACAGIDYKPFVQRAEGLAQFHFSMLKQPTALPIVRREWFCATNPDIAVVHLYIET